MRKTLFVLALGAMLTVPSAAMAAPTKADTKAASKACHDQRTAAGTKENFLALGEPTDYKNFGDCVRRGAKEEAAERRAARAAAREACASEPKGKERAACVKAATKANKAEADAQDQERVNAAKACRAEQTAPESTFDADYGTGKNAFGKCVSKKAKAQNDEPAAA
jgi:hypothetical protein